MDLGVLTHLAEGVEIRVRHELAEHQRDLIHALGATYVIDPAAPPCVKDCSRCRVSNALSNAEISRRVDVIVERETGEPVVEQMTARCVLCPWQFTGPVELARREQATHRAERHAKPIGGTMSEIECRVCGEELAPSRGRYTGIGPSCRARGYQHKDGQIVSPRETGERPAPKSEPKPPPDPDPLPPAALNGDGDTAERLREIATDEQIAFHDSEAKRHAAMRDLLAEIRGATEHLVV